MWSRLLGYRTPTSMLIYCLGCMAIFVSLRSFDELLLFTYPLMAWFAYVTFFVGKEQIKAIPAPI